MSPRRLSSSSLLLGRVRERYKFVRACLERRKEKKTKRKKKERRRGRKGRRRRRESRKKCSRDEARKRKCSKRLGESFIRVVRSARGQRQNLSSVGLFARLFRRIVRRSFLFVSPWREYFWQLWISGLPGETSVFLQLLIVFCGFGRVVVTARKKGTRERRKWRRRSETDEYPLNVGNRTFFEAWR